MKRYSVIYTRIPTNFNDRCAAIVEAESPDEARTAVEQQLKNDIVRNYVVEPAYEYKPEPSKAKIITMEG
jgi:hypothetical protein